MNEIFYVPIVILDNNCELHLKKKKTILTIHNSNFKVLIVVMNYIDYDG